MSDEVDEIRAQSHGLWEQVSSCTIQVQMDSALLTQTRMVYIYRSQSCFYDYNNQMLIGTECDWIVHVYSISTTDWC